MATVERTSSGIGDRRGDQLADAAAQGDRRARARLLTAVEIRSPFAESAVRRLHPSAGRAHLVGITGPPGAGKSSLVSPLVAGRPAVLMTTALTVEGVDELVAAMDRHRQEADTAVRPSAGRTRAEAQVWAMVVDPLRATLSDLDSATIAIRADVAAYRVDPCTAADRLLGWSRRPAKPEH